MKPNWLIEKGLFLDTEENLMNELKSQNIDFKTLSYVPFDDNQIDRIKNLFPENACVIFYGSLNFGRKLKKLPWIPGVYLNEKGFECTSYYPIFGSELLHSDYSMMPFGDLIRKKDYLFNQFGKELFIRPNSGLKEFTGTVLMEHNFEDGIKVAGIYNVEPNLLVIVSEAKKLLKEWRFVIVKQKSVSGSLYRDWTIGPETLYPDTTTKDIILLNSKSVHELCTDDKAFEYAEKVSKLYDPDNCWTLDIALTDDNEYKVIEIGCFSCAGMYGNDLNKVVSAVNEAAIEEYKEYY